MLAPWTGEPEIDPVEAYADAGWDACMKQLCALSPEDQARELDMHADPDEVLVMVTQGTEPERLEELRQRYVAENYYSFAERIERSERMWSGAP